jgi:benzoate transport
MELPSVPTMPRQLHSDDHYADKPMSAYQVLIVLMCFVLNMNDGIDVLVVSYTGSEILQEWMLTKSMQGYIYSIGLFGMTMGALFLAPLADRIGRRKLFIVAVGLDTVAMLLTFLVQNYGQLLVLRFLAGLGIGGLLPTMAAIAAEFSNRQRKDLSVGFVQAGWPIGAILMGIFTAWAVPSYGWRFAFLVAGLVSFFMLLMVIFFMPESVDYLKKHRPGNALSLINRTLAKTGHPALLQIPEQPPAPKATVKDLFSAENRDTTIRLWIGIFFGFMTLYTFISWVPSMAREAGMPFEMATYVGTMLNLGAFTGSTAIGWLASRFKLRKLIAGFLLVAFFVLLVYGNISLKTALAFILTFFIGVFVQGGFNGHFPALTRIYETRIRTTGVGWAMGAGRFGAIAGPALYGILSDMHVSFSTTIILFALPLLVSGLAIYTNKSGKLD